MKVVVTRPRDQAGPLVERLETLGHEAVVCPLIEIEPIGPNELDVSAYDWVVVTSPNAAAELAKRMRGRPGRIAAIGRGTAAALPDPPDLVSSVSTQEGLLAELPRPVGRVLFAGSENARRLLVEELQADFTPLYRTHELRPARFPDADLVVLASASAASAYGKLGQAMPAVSIGPQTTKAAREAGVEIVAEAESQDLDGLIAAVVRAWAAGPG